MQCGYDVPCADGGCVKTDDARNEWCGSNVTCMNEFTVAWQDMLVGTTQRRFPGWRASPGGGTRPPLQAT